MVERDKISRFAVPFLLGVVTLLIVVLVYTFVFYKPTSKGIQEILPDGRLPLPRFASFRSNEVNLRVGPGSQYPIVWQYRRQFLPMEVVAEFDTWRKLRDYEGSEGWANKAMLSSKRHVIVTSKTSKLHTKPEPGSGLKSILQQGVIAQLLEIQEPWCLVKVSGLKGWIMTHEVWGVTHQGDFKK